ncbi:hypothetical protein HYH03_006194 [Edaphochlamys debaryana]|uniref:Cilia- and flagella-associated protein 36 n=1 Tax=Edaphochlamys debaryana TaxID=47281 RepID=A0A836C1J6_9CHLO|nr:hypothetical protein HYH03_006194 [Edaphochlamys debaryana]|eukprot:KAG2495594.1 hypothetical protein HYH03_006194 [Edaphochlamys debaryana]
MTQTAELLSKLEDFFCSPKFTSAIGDFMGENAGKLVYAPLDEEQPLSNYDIYKAYTQLIERQLEDFIASEGLTVKDVCDACAAAQDSAEHMHLAAIDYLVASTEYEAFMQLAYDHHCMTLYEPDESTAWDAKEGAPEVAEAAAA